MLESLSITDAPATVPVPDGFNANCRIINNSGVDLLVLDGYASSDTAAEVLFEQNLKILAANDGTKIIKTGATATYVLNDSYKDEDSGELAYSYCYNLIIVRADNLFPVKVAGVMANFDTYAYDDITIAATVTTEGIEKAGDLKCMQESEAFQQNLMAFPDSILSNKFVDTCKDTMDTSDSDGDIDEKVNAFFKGTDNYKNVTLNSLTAIQTYWEAFPFIWAGYAASKRYYLYSSDSSTVSYVGSLDITAPTTAPASIDKGLPNFAFSFTPADTKQSKVQLHYVNGQFVDSVDRTTIALKGVYQLKSQFTNNADDNKIMAFMSGSVSGAKIIGYNEQLKKDSNGNWSGLYTLLHPKDAAGWMALILEVGAVIMTLELLSRPLKYLAEKIRESRAKKKGADPSKEEVDKMREEAKGKRAQDATEAQRTMDRMGPEITIKIDVNVSNSIETLQTDRTNRVTEDSRSNLTDITNHQVESVKTLSKYSMDAKIQEMSGKIGSNKAALDPAKTSTEEFAGKVETVKANATSVHESLPVETTKLASKTSTTEKAALETAKTANEEALKTQDEIDKSKDTSEKGDEGDIEMEDRGGRETIVD